MITDRTLNDVNAAKALKAKLQSGETLTTEELAQLERGVCSITMLNRIEDKISELYNLLNSYLYMCKDISIKTWVYSDIFNKTNLTILFADIKNLEDAYFIKSTTPNIPQGIYNITGANDIEQILEDLDSLIATMESNFKECNTFECGEE